MNATNNATNKVSASAEDLNAQIEALRADVAKLMSTVADDVSEGIGQAGRQISRSTRDARDSATNSVVEHPLAAVGIAVGVGLLLGLVVRKG